MLNFLGSNENLSVLAGSQWDSTFSFKDELTGDAANLDGVTFSGRVVANEYVYDMTIVRVDGYEEGNVVQVVVPPLPEGRWRYEIYATTDSGYKTRMFYGFIAAIGLADFDPEIYANRTLSVMLPGEANKRIRADWMATTAAVLAAKIAQDAAKGINELKDAAEDAIDKATDAVGRLDALDEKMQEVDRDANRAEEAAEEAQRVVDEAPRVFVPTIVDGYWAINGEVTPNKAIGEDGLDGTRMVRHIVGSVEEIPQEGETCNGGHAYYVPRGTQASTGEVRTVQAGETTDKANADAFIFSASRCWTGLGYEVKLSQMGILAGAFLSGEPSSELLYAHVYYEDDAAWVYAGCSTNAAAQIASTRTWWNFAGLVVPVGAKVKVVFTQSSAEGVEAAEVLRIATLATQDGSRCLYGANGINACVDAVFRFEIREEVLYDSYLWFDDLGNGESGWACVAGVDEQVAPATATSDGVVRLGTDAELPDGAPVGRNAAGQLTVQSATLNTPGAVTLSYEGEIADGLRIGRDAQGRIVADASRMAPATLTSLGTVKLGSKCTVMTEVPYRLSIATNQTNALCNNMLPGGALQHRRKSNVKGWDGFAGNMPWLSFDDMVFGASDYYLGISTSAQFKQSEEGGLELLPATEECVGGVLLQGAGHTVKTVAQSDAEMRALSSSIASARRLAEGSMRANATLMSIQVLTESAYDKLTTLNSNTLYIVYPD